MASSVVQIRSKFERDASSVNVHTSRASNPQGRFGRGAGTGSSSISTSAFSGNEQNREAKSSFLRSGFPTSRTSDSRERSSERESASNNFQPLPPPRQHHQNFSLQIY